MHASTEYLVWFPEKQVRGTIHTIYLTDFLPEFPFARMPHVKLRQAAGKTAAFRHRRRRVLDDQGKATELRLRNQEQPIRVSDALGFT